MKKSSEVLPKSSPIYLPNSELIAKYALDKILSYTETEINRKLDESLISPFCYEYTENLLQNTLNIMNIFYEKIDKKDDFKNNIFLYNKFYGDDDWSVIEEPVIL